MQASMKVAGIGKTMQQLRSIGDKVPNAARGAMRRAAERIVTKARDYVPEDVGNLKESIVILKDYGVRGRLEIDIDIVPTGRETTRPKKSKGVAYAGAERSGALVYAVDVLQYALLVHENYETHVAYKNGPGPITQQKMARNPGKVGSGFLRRAAEEERDKLSRYMIDVIEDVIERERQ